MKSLHRAAFVLLVLSLVIPLRAQVPQLVNYQGRVAVGAVNFNGAGQFKFALVDTAGANTYWSNDGTSAAGSQPTNAVSLTVTNGLYSVLLGDTSVTHMPTAIPASVWTNPDVRLRVWFNDGVNGFQQLTPDQRLAPNGYLPDGAITSAKIANGAVGTAQIASGAVGATQLTSGLTLGGTTIGTFSGPLTGNVAGNVTGSAASFSGSLTGDVTGTQGATVVSLVDGSPAANVHAAELLANAATNANTASAIVKRDASGNFSAGTITFGGGLSLPATDNSGTVGVITQNGSSLISTFGAQNFFAGSRAGNFSMTGGDNTASGYSALMSNTTGTGNTVVGASSLQYNTTGSDNTAAGYGALDNNTTAGVNTAVGHFSLQHQSYNNGGAAWNSWNVAVGDSTLNANQPISTTTGIQNTALGTGALSANTTGSGNIGLGYNAGNLLTTGSNNIDIGHPGVAGESNIIRIGDGVTQTDIFLTGTIHGNGSGLTGITATGLAANSVTSTQIAAGAVGSSQLASGITLGGTTTLGGGLSLPATSSSSVGVITQNGSSLISTYGNQNFFAGSGAGNFTLTGGGNTATGYQALKGSTSGNNNTATGYQALQVNTTGLDNTAVGCGALQANTTASANAAFGSFALYGNTTGHDNVGFGPSALGGNTTGNNNIAVGSSAGGNLTTGSNNIDIGHAGVAGESNIIRIGDGTTQSDTYLTGIVHGTGFTNVAVTGEITLPATSSSTVGVLAQNGSSLIHTFGTQNFFAGSGAGNFTLTGSGNTASGYQALHANTTGFSNAAMGMNALFNNTTGTNNTAIGVGALFSNTTGSSNIALGVLAGESLTTGSNNIDIGHAGVAGESNIIRIGTSGTQTATFIAGISGVTSSGGAAVFVNSNGQLGTLTSSRRFKDHIQEMAAASEALLALRPVTFRYKPEIDPQGLPQWGLIAEDVAQVNPDLVVRDGHGVIQTVRYEQVNAMLLNEFLKDHHRAEARDVEIAELKKRVAELEAKDKEREARMARLESLMPASAEVKTVSLTH